MHVIPLMITTMDALVSVLEERPALLYIDESLLQITRKQLHSLLHRHSYRLYRQGKHGVFYLREDIGQVTFDDPLGIF